MIKSVNEPLFSRDMMLTPGSINEPLPLPEGPPKIEGINPTGVPEGTASQLVVVHGSNFTEGCVINFNGANQATNYERADKINAILSLATMPVGEYPVVVKLLGAETSPIDFAVTAGEAAGSDYADPDELEDELEQAREEGDFAPTHRSKPKTKR